MLPQLLAFTVGLTPGLLPASDGSLQTLAAPPSVSGATDGAPASSFVNDDGRTLSLSTWGPAKLVATVAGTTLTGASTNDTLQDLEFRSNLAGSAGDDSYYVVNTGTAVVESTGRGTDTVFAYRDYSLPPNVEHLVAAGNGYTYAGNALDNLVLSRGTRNIVAGGPGNDVVADQSTSTTRFQFRAGDGRDVVVGFSASGTGADLIRLDGYGYRSFNDVRTRMTQSGRDVVISHANGDRVVIKDNQIGSLSAANFLLPIDLSNYSVTFSEDFNALSLVNPGSGAGIWKTQFASGSQNSRVSGYSSRTLAPNSELQIYVDPYLTGTGPAALGLNPFRIVDGTLWIRGGRTPDAVKSALWDYAYTSGLLTTQTSFSQTYGYFEIRARLPSGQGVWPAFWLLPTERNGISELDVFEQLGGTTIHQTAHAGTTSAPGHTGFANLVSTATSRFHTYGVLWTEQTVTWYIDGVASASMPTPADMHQPMYMLVNLAIGGTWGGNPRPDFTGADFLVDYVRVYAAGNAVTSGSGDASLDEAQTGSGLALRRPERQPDRSR